MTAALTRRVTPTGEILGAGPLPLRGLPTKLTYVNGVAVPVAPQVVPLRAVVSQVFDVTLNGQFCTIKVYFKRIQVPAAAAIPTDPPVYERATPGFLDLYVGGTLLRGGVLCQHANLIVRERYAGFVGDLAFVDTRGTEDPSFDGLGTRWLLVYLANL